LPFHCSNPILRSILKPFETHNNSWNWRYPFRRQDVDAHRCYFLSSTEAESNYWDH
jgi:hypothetical protein